MSSRLGHFSILLVPAAFLTAFFASLMLHSNELSAYQTYKTNQKQVNFIPPEEAPNISQSQIDVAMEMFSIEGAPHVKGPNLDLELEDRGLTTGGILEEVRSISIGPAAFISWSMLGSTLGHEIEVHAQQSFLYIVLKDAVQKKYIDARVALGAFIPAFKPSSKESFEMGTWGAEREAYLYEVENADRFKLTTLEKNSILNVMERYYPIASK